MQQLLGAGGVLANLGDERVDAVEALLATQAGDKSDTKLVTVQIVLPMEKMCFDCMCQYAEGWAYADVRYGGERRGIVIHVRPAGIDAVTGKQ